MYAQQTQLGWFKKAIKCILSASVFWYILASPGMWNDLAHEEPGPEPV